VGGYRIWVLGFPLFTFPTNSLLAFLLFHGLDITALILLIGLVLALHRRFHDLALIAVVLLTLQALCINRLAGVAYPLWSPRNEADKVEIKITDPQKKE
jgi:hypothetical protein